MVRFACSNRACHTTVFIAHNSILIPEVAWVHLLNSTEDQVRRKSLPLNSTAGLSFMSVQVQGQLHLGLIGSGPHLSNIHGVNGMGLVAFLPVNGL